MTSREVLQEFPTVRIKPEDGMAVTAQVWEAAHEYHRQRLRFHDLLRHGPGILTGLDVIASEPADSTVYIMPGIAVDPCGEAIALLEPMAYDLGSTRGHLYLILTYEESHHRFRPDREDELPRVDCRFGIEATNTLPDGPFVELARIRRAGRQTPITDALDPIYPKPNELDLRYRPEMTAKPHNFVSIGVSYMGGPATKAHGRGVDFLARAFRHAGQSVWVDGGVPLATGLEEYTLLILVGQEAFALDLDAMMVLHAYLQGGGTVLVDSCRSGTEGGDPPSDVAFLDLLGSYGIHLEELPGDHPLLAKPNLFAAPPPGFETGTDPRVLIGGGVILSQCDYGCLWQGKRRRSPEHGGSDRATRGDIRAAVEWGENILAYAQSRRDEAIVG